MPTFFFSSSSFFHIEVVCEGKINIVCLVVTGMESDTGLHFSPHIESTVSASGMNWSGPGARNIFLRVPRGESVSFLNYTETCKTLSDTVQHFIRLRSSWKVALPMRQIFGWKTQFNRPRHVFPPSHRSFGPHASSFCHANVKRRREWALTLAQKLINNSPPAGTQNI